MSTKDKELRKKYIRDFKMLPMRIVRIMRMFPRRVTV
jgi:hypothetical protein